MKEETGTNPQIRLKKPDPKYRLNKDKREHQVAWKTTEFGIDEIDIIVEKLKARNGHIWERARVAYVAGEIGKELCYGYPDKIADDIVRYLIEELEAKKETMFVAGKDTAIEEKVVGQPNIASTAALVALEKMSTNDDLYMHNLAKYGIIPKLKRMHKITIPELRPLIRQTAMNIQRICDGDTRG